MPASTFFDVVREAVADISEHGYDSQARVDGWIAKIVEAASRSMTPSHMLQQTLDDALRAIYRRLVDKGAIYSKHKGVARFTVEKIRPKLQAELQRRIAASADLIRLNRQEAVSNTLRRFSGWATSVPAGGAPPGGRREAADDIKKALRSLPFRERRVLIDQGNKFVSALNDIVATDGGAIAAIWRHHHVLYPREEHVAREGKVFLVRGSWAAEAGLVKAAADGYVDEIERPGEFVSCRCSYEYLYHLRQLPDSMLTAKGRAELKRVRLVG